ncbi:hypothetical protein JTE90_002100 [Oedothorax gibbosus]|uniref:Uncharacterized protein n=1 Tax=Oedothorax gibbosus TaxID=931172 RepID=A0AAV6V6R9_9ARAC|nr:hypothetical protein JTE90_002100 [Oedothorax gibbosus]
MTSSTEHSANSIPVSNLNDIQEAREAANKALKNIQTLYNEIMTPKMYSDFEDEYISEFSSNSTSNSPVHERHSVAIPSLKSKISSDLCNSCRKYLSYCSSCRRSSKDKSVSLQKGVVCNNVLRPSNKYINEPVSKFKITVPRPFLLTVENIKRQEAKEIKIAKLKEELQKEAEKELNVKIHPHPVPKHVSLPIYEDMAKQSETRKKERRSKCQEILEKETKPFNLSSSAKINRAKSVSDIPKESENQFKARPVPKNILSENVSKRIRDKEKLRKILMNHRAEQMLKQSALPFTPKPIPRSFSLSNLSSEKDKNVKLSKPNVDAITKRLYTIKCRETIENWNNKVLESNKQRTMKVTNDFTKHKLFPEKELPFYNFPVRMSTAAVLRERQIREEIYVRKRKEEQEEIFKEEMAHKKKDFLKNIWPRLKSVGTVIDTDKEIEEKIKSFKVSQRIRQQEYKKEIEEMMKRVSKQYLLIERQSKGTKEIAQEQPVKSDEEDSESNSSIQKKTSEKYLSNDEPSENHSSNEEASENHSSSDEASENPPANNEAFENPSSNNEASEKHVSNKDLIDFELSDENDTKNSEELENSSDKSGE